MSEGLQSVAHEILEPTGFQPVVVQFVGAYGPDPGTGIVDFGIFAADNDGVRPLVLPGEPVANLPGAQLRFMITEQVNQRGDIFIGGSHQPAGGGSIDGLYLYRQGTLELVTESCFDAGVGGAQACIVTYAPELISLNDMGQIAFLARMTGPGVDSRNNQSIWATDRDGKLVMIARTGDTLEIAPGVQKTLYQLNFQSAVRTNSSYGYSDLRQFNGKGQLVFAATFTDGTRGLFVSNAVAVPEPGTAAILLMTCFVATRRRTIG